MQVLVTGGAGFIGSHLARALLDDGCEVWIVDNLSTGHLSNLPKAAQFVKLDLGERGMTAMLPDKRFDAVLHLAGQSSGEASFDDPEYDVTANGLSTMRLSRWAAGRGARVFVFASSMSVYGRGPAHPVTEEHPTRPISYYGASKLYGELACQMAATDEMRVVAFRMFNVYGPGQNFRNLKQGMVNIYLTQLLRNQSMLVKGSLDRVRDFIFVSDVVAAWRQAIASSVGGIFNLGTGVPTSVRTLIAKLLEFTGKGQAYPINVGAGTPGDQQAMCADISQARETLQWEPKVALDDGLKQMVHWGQSIALGPEGAV